jgi:pimeloyl-ACP methyl ester carboxylesterase
MLSLRRASLGRRLLRGGGAILSALALGCSLLFGLNTAAVAGASATGSLVLHHCAVSGYAARCGTLMVPEDRLTRTGRQIPIRVVVVPATSAPRQPDPIVYFDGGPGSSAVDDAVQEIPELSLDTTRDYVFIDQRGTAASNLTCPAFPGLGDVSVLRAKVASCLSHTPADIRFYTTAMAADDVPRCLAT